jgi:hypothetical protein
MFQAWNLFSYMKEYGACLLKDKERDEFSK